MEHLNNVFKNKPFDAEKNEVFNAVRYPQHLTVTGFEALSIGENFNLFFKEISTSIDKRMAVLARSIHTVDFKTAQQHLKQQEILYVKNTTLEILTPEGYTPGMGNMMAYTKSVAQGVYIICSLKTEAARLYDWMKQIIQKGRMQSEFKWTIGEFGQVVNNSENFLKNLPDNSRNLRYNLGQVYMSFEEAWDVMNTFNSSVQTLGSRDIELVVKIMSDVYDLGQLLVRKIQANDILISEVGLKDIEIIVNKFAQLTNVSGAMMILLNELTAVFNEQLKTLQSLKY